MISFVFLVIVASASANAVAKCPNVKTVENFDITKYGEGIWYELAKYPNVMEGKGICGYAQYTPQEGGFRINNVDYFEGKIREIKGSGKLAPDAGTNGNMLFTYPYGPNGSLITVPVNVVYTDYKNYAVVYYCRFNNKLQSIQEFSWILSRFKALDADSKAKVDFLLGESAYLNAARYQWNDFSEEACKAF